MREDGTWRIYLLGGFRVAFGPRSVADQAWRRRKASALIKLLALAHGHRLHREQLMETLWPDQTPAAAANSLHQSLHSARQALASVNDQGAHLLEFERDQLCLCPDGELWIDAQAFEAAAAQAAGRSGQPAAYEAALALYTGDLLPEDRYEDWAEPRRVALRLTYLSLLTDLAGLYEAQGEPGPAMAALQRALSADSAHEAAHRSLMRLYYQAGDRGQALRQYQALREALRREVDAEPDAASQALYRDIQNGRPVERADAAAQRAQAISALAARPAAVAAGRAAPRRDNLPHSLTGFVGRERERAEVLGLLDATRLITLTGPGGCGKTRLALEVARAALAAFPAGVWLVELAAVAEPTLVARTVATVLEAPEEAGATLTEALMNYLCGKRLLLVLDNCEHLIEACAELAGTLLVACPDLCLLATSRERLRVPGELAWPVPPLAFPDPQRPPPLPELAGYAAVRLFGARAATARPGFAVSEQNAPAIAQICARLDGLPLGIELAAARTALLTPQQIAAGLEDRFGLLTGGARTALPRHKTLRGLLDWSYELLTGPEQTLFRRLAVFQGGFTLDAVQTICEGSLDVLAQLVDKSLVAVETGGREARYGLLDTIRQYALEKLAAHDETAWLQDRSLLYYLALAEAAEPGLKSAGRAPWLETLDAETGNLRAALAWAEQGHGGPDAGLRLAAALYWFWQLRGHVQEGRQWLDRMLASAPVPPASELARARALVAVVELSIGTRAVFATAPTLLMESIALARTAGPPAGPTLSAALASLAFHRAHEGLQAVQRYEEESLTMARAGDDRWHLASVLLSLGSAHEVVNDSGAAAYYAESLDLYRELADPSAVARAQTRLGHLALAHGDYARARGHLEDAMALHRSLGERSRLAWDLGYLAEVAFGKGAYAEDARLLDEAIELFWDLGLSLAYASCTYHRGLTAERLGDYALAERLLRQSLLEVRRLDYREGLVGCLVGHASLALAQGRGLRAAHLLGAVTAECQAPGWTWVHHQAARLAYSRALATLQQIIAEPECAAAWARGQAMSLADAAALALAE